MTKVMLIVIGVLVGGTVLYIAWLRRRLDLALTALETERTRQRSISASYGRISEQWFPLMPGYPFDSANFRFLGSPIDGIQFEEDRVVLVEFKAAGSQLSPTQLRIKRLVQEGRVEWSEHHFQDS